MTTSSVVIRDLDLKRIPTPPLKAHSPLIVDAYAVLTFSPAGELLQPVAWRNPQVLERPGRMKENQLLPRGTLELEREGWDTVAGEDPFSAPISEGANHRLL